MIGLLVFLPDKKMALLIDAALIVLVVAAMSLKQRSLSLGVYAVVAWCFHAAALPLGFFHPRRQPDDWIESKVVSKDH